MKYVFKNKSINALITDCGSLTNPSNGAVDTSSGTVVGSPATYSCNTGYRLQGTDSRGCQETGLWSLVPPTCIIFSMYRDQCFSSSQDFGVEFRTK